MPSYKLHYFNSRGRAEPARLILAYAGAKYEDVRIAKEDFPALKPTLPFGQLPVLEVDGKFLPQSFTICRYLAREHGLTGADNFEAALADAFVDSVGDLLTAAMPAYRETDPVKRKEIGGIFVQEKLMPFLKVAEKYLTESGSGFVVGKQLTWADIVIFNFLDEAVARMGAATLNPFPKVTAHHQKIAAIPAIKSWIESRPKSEN